jgi:nitric oxide synthase-interacting protein
MPSSTVTLQALVNRHDDQPAVACWYVAQFSCQHGAFNHAWLLLLLLQAFWLPNQVEGAKVATEKPDTNTYCPASGNKLRLKDLVSVKFTPVPEGSSGRHMDPITKDTFTNASKLVVLAATGDVVLEQTYKQCIKPDGVFGVPPVKIKDKEVIHMKGGGTGFAAHDKEAVQATKHFALGPGSGKTDLRGQHQGPRSMGGLVFMN